MYAPTHSITGIQPKRFSKSVHSPCVPLVAALWGYLGLNEQLDPTDRIGWACVVTDSLSLGPLSAMLASWCPKILHIFLSGSFIRANAAYYGMAPQATLVGISVMHEMLTIGDDRCTICDHTSMMASMRGECSQHISGRDRLHTAGGLLRNSSINITGEATLQEVMPFFSSPSHFRTWPAMFASRRLIRLGRATANSGL